ncbi:MAG TPA: cation:proton antiporter [Nitriliruptorales bacterium]|nr:cation:proton antiporter [Nitriliruptorales bacterium]
MTNLLLVAGLAAFAFVVGRATKRFLSEVIVFIAIGILIGPEGLRLVDEAALAALDPLLAVSLGAIVFLIGERLELPALRQVRHTLTPIAVLDSALTFLLCLGVMIAVGLSFQSAYLLAAIALSTSPTTLLAVIAERRAKGSLSDHLQAATALNNVTSAVLYGLGLPLVLAVEGSSGAGEGLVAFAQLVLASAVIGTLGAMVLRRGWASMGGAGEQLLFVLVVLLVAVATSRAVQAPVVLSTLVMGALTANDPRDLRPLFGMLRILEAPIYLVFFVIAGAGVHLEELASIGGFGVAFVLARGAGKLAGGWAGAHLTRSGRRAGWGAHMGLGLLPFAGMAIGLAAFTFEKAAEVGVDQLGGEVSAIVLGAVVVFELLGPFAVTRALDRTGESGRAAVEQEARAAAEDRLAPHRVRHILFPISSPEMARAKAGPVADLAVSAGATLTGLHAVPPGSHDPDVVDPALSVVRQLAAARGLSFEPIVREASSVVDAIVETAREAAVDLIVMGESAPRLLDRGGRRLVHEVAERADVPVIVIPTVSRGPVRPARRDQVPVPSASVEDAPGDGHGATTGPSGRSSGERRL